jgi:hypothetical protein
MTLRKNLGCPNVSHVWRRLNWVRVIVDDDGVRAEAVGIRYRHPAVVPISLRLAADLARDGTPLVVLRQAS